VGHLKPITSLKAAAPQKLFQNQLIACNCKSGCERSCECKRAGLQCNDMCGYCTGHGCSNRVVVEDDADDEDDDLVDATQADARVMSCDVEEFEEDTHECLDDGDFEHGSSSKAA
jgi:hypothetical protein